MYGKKVKLRAVFILSIFFSLILVSFLIIKSLGPQKTRDVSIIRTSIKFFYGWQIIIDKKSNFIVLGLSK